MEPADNPLTTLPTSSVEQRAQSEDTIINDPEVEEPVAGPSTVPSPRPVDIPFPPTKRGRRREVNDGSSSVPERSDGIATSSSSTQIPPAIVKSAPGSTSRMEMDVDEQISPSSYAPASSSPASSSVPSSVASSSRSSLRARNVSMTQLAPSVGGAASPRVDMTTATGRVGMEIDSPATQGQGQIASSSNGEQTDAEGSVSQSTTDNPSHGRTTHGPGPGGKLLKSLGGIFRWHDPAHHSDPPSSSKPPPVDTTKPTTNPGNSNNNGHVNRLVPPHQSPGRRVKSPLMSSYQQQGEPPALAAPVTPRIRTRGESTGEC